ncbi:MAG: McrC family protein [Symplocastrum torsivum CPER-KK1]|uniref:McrC family protein n=1 Tax=Symplocastrum torsivum CPER-KK1 TaxID=450513 RepID=A0A951PT59_9CYAN|nr:McrC family protein [Symplocastrum torsivum CPER-KK1]
MTTIFEYGFTAGFDWTERDLAAIERLRRVLGVEVLRAITRRGQRELQATQYVGVFRLGRRTVQVLPKMFRSEDEDKATKANRNLLYLLEYTGQLVVRETAVTQLMQNNLDWFELLTRLLVSNLREEWHRGAYRSYQTVEDVLPVLKGKWQLLKQLRRPERQHLFAVAYDEFSADNSLNRIFRYVVERLWQLSRDATNRKILGELRHWMEEVTLLPSATVNDASLIPITRLNQRYEPLLNLAKLFLDNSSLQLSAGDLATFAFVFDMNKLFEGFIVNFIRRHREEILPAELGSCELIPQAYTTTLHLAHTSHGEPVFRLKPDLAFRNGDNFPLLLDAKYKQLKPTDRKLGVSESDFYQMHAYAHRYQSPRVLLLYPQTADIPQPLQAEFTLEDSEQVIVAATVDLRGDLSKSQERDNLITRLKTILMNKRG